MTDTQRAAITPLDIRTPLRAARTGGLIACFFLIASIIARLVDEALLMLPLAAVLIVGSSALGIYEWCRVRLRTRATLRSLEPGVYALRAARPPFHPLAWRALHADTPVEPLYEEIAVPSDDVDSSLQSVAIAAPIFAALLTLLAPTFMIGLTIFVLTLIPIVALLLVSIAFKALRRVSAAPTFTQADPAQISHKRSMTSLRRTFAWDRSSLVIAGVSRHAVQCLYVDHHTGAWRTHLVARRSLDDLLGVAHAAVLERQRRAPSAPADDVPPS